MIDKSSNTTKSLMLVGGIIALLMWLGHSFAGETGAAIALIVGILLAINAYWFCDRLVLSLYGAKEIDQDDNPMLYATVAYIAERAKINRPRIFLIDDNTPNAFATGRTPNHGIVVITKGLLYCVNKDELAGVIAHLVAHIQHQDTLLASLAASVGGGIALLANTIQAIFIFGMGSRNKPGNNKLAVILISMVAPMIAIIIQTVITRERHFYADEKAAELCENPKHVANALRKIEIAKDQNQLEEVEQNPSTAHLFIVSPLRTKKWKLLFASHPPIGERIERLEYMSA